MHARLLILRKKIPLYGLILVCTFIDFKEKFPLHVYSILHVYWHWYVQNFMDAKPYFYLKSIATLVPQKVDVNVWPSKFYPCTFILSCTFNVFLRIFPPARLFHPTCLFGTLEYGLLTDGFWNKPTISFYANFTNITFQKIPIPHLTSTSLTWITPHFVLTDFT